MVELEQAKVTKKTYTRWTKFGSPDLSPEELALEATDSMSILRRGVGGFLEQELGDPKIDRLVRVGPYHKKLLKITQQFQIKPPASKSREHKEQSGIEAWHDQFSGSPDKYEVWVKVDIAYEPGLKQPVEETVEATPKKSFAERVGYNYDPQSGA